MTGQEILKAMDNGSTLHGGRFGFWLMDVFNSRCTNVHNGAARSLARRGLIKKVDDTQYAKTEIRTGDKVTASRRIGHGLAEKGQIMTILDDRGNGWFLVQPDGGCGFLTKRADFILHNTLRGATEYAQH
jgi:hypothetical protein